MKKLLMIIAIATLCSCKKEIDPLQENGSTQLTAQASVSPAGVTVNSSGSKSPTSSVYDVRVFNCTSNEWVHLTGTIRYSTKELFNKPYFLYQVNLQGIVGYGETSGVAYHGGGVVVEVINLGGATESTIIQKFNWVATNGDKLIFDQRSHLTVNHNGVTVVLVNEYTYFCNPT